MNAITTILDVDDIPLMEMMILYGFTLFWSNLKTCTFREFVHGDLKFI
jgi:hypothetical protein